MRSDDVTPKLAAKIADALAPYVGYLHRLKRRMEIRGFPKNAPLFQVTDAAYRLRMEFTISGVDPVMAACPDSWSASTGPSRLGQTERDESELRSYFGAVSRPDV
jgi:hypothetical protein